MKRKKDKQWIVNIILVYCIIAIGSYMATDIYAALIRPYTIDNIDYLSEEPFKGYNTVRSSLVLTNAYVDTDVLDMKQYRKSALLFNVTKGSLTSIQYRIWVSYDNVIWYVEATETVAAGSVTDTPGVYTTTTDENYYKILNMYPPYMKLSVKGTGTVTGSLLAVYIVGAM